LFFKPRDAVRDLVFIWNEQRPAPPKCDADLRGGETARPIEREPLNRTGNSTAIEYKVGNGRETAGFRHDRVKLIIFSSRQAGCSYPVQV
jgi:hypothetical protein